MITIILTFAFAISNSFSTSPLPEDSVKVFNLGEINVGSSKISSKLANSNIAKVSYRMIQSSDATSVSNLQFTVPSAVVRTNSRGETMLFMRGAAERQLAIYFDGMPLNIPWDNRADLSFLPTDIIGQMNVSNNTSTMLYGANILGGVLDLNSVERINNGSAGSLRFQYNDAGGLFTAGNFEHKNNDLSFLLNLSALSNPSLNAPSGIDTNQFRYTRSESITNTSQERVNLFSRLKYDIDESQCLSLTINYTTDEKGVQPLSSAALIDAGEAVRFWNYPQRDRLFAILNYSNQLSDNFIIKSTFWFDQFNQQIDDFGSDQSYRTIASVQKDNDLTLGARITTQYIVNENSYFNLGINYFNSKHEEIIDQNETLEYEQNTMSVGLDYNFAINDFTAKVGIAYDYNQTPKTGVFEDLNRKSDSDYAAFLNLKYNFNRNWAAIASTSRRTRFQSMREGLSGALNRFLPNPDLKPETGILNDIGIEANYGEFKFSSTGFFNMYENLIVQIRKSAAEDSQRRRMRINRDEATIMGLENMVEYSNQDLFIRLNLTALTTKGSDGESIQDTLENRPNVILGLMARYNFTQNVSLQFEQEYLGRQFQLLGSNFTQFDSPMIANLRLNYKTLVFEDSYFIEFFVRINNITNAIRQSQLGIIEPGRTFVLGIIARI